MGTFDTGTNIISETISTPISGGTLSTRVTALEESTHQVIDNLESTSTSDALSANQGRVINEQKIGDITTDFGQQLTALLAFNL